MDEHIILVHDCCNLFVHPNCGFHLTTVDTSVASEVDEYRLVVALSVRHTLVIVAELRMNLVCIEVEVLCLHRRSKCTHSLKRSAPKSRNHIDGERYRAECQEEAWHSYMIVILIIMRELDLAEKVHAEECEEGNPESEECFAVKNAPSVSEVGNREELECESKFHESENHLHGVHPSATLRH